VVNNRRGLQATSEDVQWLGVIRQNCELGNEAKPVPAFNKSKLIALGFVETRAGLLLVTEKGKTRLGA
jgi:hypothetical protein